MTEICGRGSFVISAAALLCSAKKKHTASIQIKRLEKPPFQSKIMEIKAKLLKRVPTGMKEYYHFFPETARDTL